MRKAVLLDTSFFLRFLNESDPLFENADGYFLNEKAVKIFCPVQLYFTKLTPISPITTSLAVADKVND